MMGRWVGGFTEGFGGKSLGQKDHMEEKERDGRITLK
jgi:hypothetical protein